MLRADTATVMAQRFSRITDARSDLQLDAQPQHGLRQVMKFAVVKAGLLVGRNLRVDDD